MQHGETQGPIFGPLLFLIYINEISKSVSDKSKPVLFADDTSFINANHDKDKFEFNVNEIFNEINKWFCINLLTLNYDKIHFLQLATETDYKMNMRVSFCERKIVTTQSFKALGLTNDTNLTWNNHITELITRLNKACYAIRSIKPFMLLDAFRIT